MSMRQTNQWFTMVLLVIVSVLWISPSLRAEKYKIDPDHSMVAFKIRHMMISKVNGKFDKFSGEFNYDEKDPKTWNAIATIDANSIDTAQPNRDKHLRSPDFFDVTKFPSLDFKSTGVSDWTAGKAKLAGLLTIHGIEKPVVLDLEIGGTIQDPWGKKRAGFEASTKINRKDFGILWNKTLGNGGLLVGEEVEISIHIEGIAESVN